MVQIHNKLRKSGNLTIPKRPSTTGMEILKWTTAGGNEPEQMALTEKGIRMLRTQI
jgi:hypothetical protein